MQFKSSLTLAALAVVLSLSLAGCGDASGKTAVSGKVTFQDAPLESGTITFRGTDDGGSAGGQIINGEYSLESPPGPKRVEIIANRAAPGELDSLGMPLVQQYIPEKYNQQSELTADVKAGETNVFDFKLEAE